MTFVLNDSFFIIKPRYQLAFGIGGNWTSTHTHTHTHIYIYIRFLNLTYERQVQDKIGLLRSLVNDLILSNQGLKQE